MKRIFWVLILGVFVVPGITYAAKVCLVYSCNAGYFSNGAVCSRCPSLPRADGGTQYGSTPGAGNYSQTSCYMPTGVKYKDNTGEFEFTSNCNYSN